MSNLTSVKPANLSELPAGLTEVFLDNLGDNFNEVARYPLHQSYDHLAYENAARADKEWSQVFDLGDAALICLVKDEQLDMRLVHLNERPLEEVRDFNRTQGQVSRAFNTSEADIVTEIKQTFKRFEKAKIQLDAPIVANLCLIDNKKGQNGGDVQNAAVFKGVGTTIFSKAPDQCHFTLVLATQSNHVYHINFERHFLQKGNTIHVRQSDSEIFAHLQGRQIRCFEQIHDFVNKRDLFVIGSACYVPQSSDNRDAAITASLEQSLTFLDQNRDAFQVMPPQQPQEYVQGSQTGEVKRSSLLSRLYSPFQQSLFGQRQNQPAAAPQQPNGPIASKFQGQKLNESLCAPQTNTRNMEGVIAIKVLTNNLLAVTYTNGLFRIIQVSNFSVLIETNLLDGGDMIGQRMVEAQVESATQQAVSNYQQTSLSKSIVLGIRMAVENSHTGTKQHCLQVLCLRFDSVAVVQVELENDIILGNNCELIHMRQQVMPIGTAITEVTPGDNSAFLYTTWDVKTRETSIFSTSTAQPIWDRGSQEVKHQIADKVPIAIDIVKQAQQPQLQQALRRHYAERMTVPGRFSPDSIQALLQDNNLFDPNLSIKENLVRATQRVAIDSLPLLLANLLEIEARHGRILALSVPFGQRSSWRVLVRPLGISVVTETSYVSSIEAAISLGSYEGETYWATNDTKLLIEFLSLVRTSLSDSLHMLGQRIAEKPTEIRESAAKCIRSAKNEDAVQKLKYKLQTAAPDIQDQLHYLDTEIIDRLVLERAGKALAPAKSMMMNIEMDVGDQEVQKLSDMAMKAQEETIRQEVGQLLSLIIDLYLGQLLLSRATQHNQPLQEQRLQKQESWIRQLTALLITFNADYQHKSGQQLSSTRSKSKHQPTSTAAYSISRHGSVLQHLLQAEENFTDQPLSSLLSTTIQTYCFKDSVAIDQPTFTPHIVRKLCELNQHEFALKYVRVTGIQSLGSIFAAIFCMTCTAEKCTDREEFMRLTHNLIGRTLQLSEKQQGRVDLGQSMLVANRTAQVKEAIRSKIEGLSQHSLDTRLHFLLLCATELSSTEVITMGGTRAEHLSAFFIKTCLMFESQTQVKTLADWTPQEQDFLLACLFDSQKSVASGIDLLYRSVTQLRDLQKRQAYLLKFFEITRATTQNQNVRSAILTRCPFSQADITLLVEAIQNKLSLQLQESQSQKWLLETSNLVQIYHDVSQLYNWQDQFTRFMWSLWQGSVKDLLRDCAMPSKKSNMKLVLTLETHMMTLAYTACQSCGKDYYFHTSCLVKPVFGNQTGSASKKRGYFEAMAAGSMEIDSQRSSLASAATIPDENQAFWSKADKLKNQPAQFNSGKLIRIDSKSFLGALTLCKAQLLCAEQQIQMTISHDPQYLSRVLAELGHVDLAVELALSNDFSPAFAIATTLDKIKKRDIREGENEEENVMRQSLLDDTVERYLRRIKVEHLGELAQYLVALRIDFSPSLKRMLIKQKQVAYVVGCYLVPEVFDVVRAVEFVCGAVNEGDNEAASMLIHSDLNQVVNLMQHAQNSGMIFKDELRANESKRDSIRNSLAQGNQSLMRRTFQAGPSGSFSGGSSGLAGLEAAMNGGEIDVLSAILAEQQNLGYDQFESTALVEKNISKCRKHVEILTWGFSKLQQVLQMEMRGK